jgi:UDP-N-acetylglucosamine 4,6-dehydratase
MVETVKKVLVTGGAGSIGSRVVRRLFEQGHEVHVIDVDETRLYFMLRDDYDYKIKTYVIDIRDEREVEECMAQGFDLVIHAAAYKHVPTGEYFPSQMAGVNIQGAINVFRAAMRYNVPKVVDVSTDKAAYPTGVMGATKLIQERIAISMRGKSNTKFNVVRFGNVVMSRGGVVERFAHMTREGKRLQIMDPTMTRFWMDYKDAIDLVLYAAEDDADACVYTMITKGWRLDDLARAYGQTPADWDELGRRKGEKIDEVLITEEESARAELVTESIIRVWPEMKNGQVHHDLQSQIISSNPDQLMSIDEIKEKLMREGMLDEA